MKTALISTTGSEPLSLAIIKDHVRIAQGQTRDDDLLQVYRVAARERVEQMANIKLRPYKYKLYLDAWPNSDAIDLPFAPLRSVPSTGVVYTNSAGNSTTFSSTAWGADTVSQPGRVVLAYQDDWPTETLTNNNPISIEFNCGYNASSDLPYSLKAAMLLTISHLYENREEVVIGQGVAVFPLPKAVDALVANYRNFTF